MKILDRNFYMRDTEVVARALLGKLLVHYIDDHMLSGLIVETEAYRADDDPASHACRGKTTRNIPMFGPVGYSYVYFIYGNHFCFNIVAKAKNQSAGAVLIRALEPIKGIEVMQKHRNQTNLSNLTNGPGKLTQALNISKEQNALDLTTQGKLYVVDYDTKSHVIETSCRVGIRVGTEKKWRFYCKGNVNVSK